MQRSARYLVQLGACKCICTLTLTHCSRTMGRGVHTRVHTHATCSHNPDQWSPALWRTLYLMPCSIEQQHTEMTACTPFGRIELASVADSSGVLGDAVLMGPVCKSDQARDWDRPRGTSSLTLSKHLLSTQLMSACNENLSLPSAFHGLDSRMPACVLAMRRPAVCDTL